MHARQARRRALLPAALCALLFAPGFAPAAPFGSGTAITIIRPAAIMGWTNACRLTNSAIEAVVAPDVGRVVHLGLRSGQNLLRLAPDAAGLPVTADNTNTWINLGGEWLWPAAQSRWKDFAASDWPPPAVLADRPWAERAWRAPDGGSLCLLTRAYGAPLNLKMRRLIKIDKSDARVVIHQRAVRTGASDVPVALWNIIQVAAPRRVFIPVDAQSAFPGGLQPMIFGPPSTEHVTAHGDVAVYDCAVGGEHKLGSDSRRRWIAAQAGGRLILARMDAEDGSFPDGGCTVEMYANSGLGYAEIETLSPERPLKPRENLHNLLIIECHTLPPGLPPAEVVDHLKKLLGE
jgi:hypothetical protein